MENRSIDPRAQQIYNLKSLSRTHRDRFLGGGWLDNARQLFELCNPVTAYSGIGPIVSIPQFQQLSMMEATDLSSISPRVIIHRTKGGQEPNDDRDKEREEAFRDHWDWIQAGTSLFYSFLWSMFAGTGWLEVGFDPLGDNGNGRLYQAWLDPECVYPDPYARWQDPCELNWSYVVIERQMSIDEIEMRHSAWGQGPGMLIRSREDDAPQFGDIPQRGDTAPFPIRTLWGPGSPEASPDSRRGDSTSTRVVPGHICFLKDYSQYRPSSARSSKVGDTGIEIPGTRFRYPYGRMIIEAGGQILYDDTNPWGGIDGKTLFPVVPVYSIPPMTSIWCPPPYRYSGNLEQIAGQTLSQIYENIIRTNQSVTYLWKDNEIDINTFLGLPGEMVEIAGQKPPVHVWGNPMPSQVFNQPQYLLDKARELQGYTKTRMGEASQGNIGSDLYEATIGEGRKLTRMRSLLLYPTLNLLTTLLYGGMCRFYRNSRTFPSFNSESADESRWKPGGDEGSARLHPGSVQVISEEAQKRLSLQLRQLSLLSKQRTLEDINYPHAADASEEIEQEEKLAALAALRKR